MPENAIIAKFKVGDHIEFTNTTTSANCTYVVVGESFTLSKGIIYKIPVENKSLDLANFNVIKDTHEFSDKIIIRYVSDGSAVVYSLTNGVIINNGDLLGSVI